MAGRLVGQTVDLHAGTAHPPRAGHLQYLLQRGSVRPGDGGPPGGPGQNGCPQAGRAVLPQGSLCRGPHCRAGGLPGGGR
jgi:hypothetical protein